MNLDDAQRKKVAAWVAEGLKLSEIQTRLASELGARLTYMEVRLLVDDLKLTPKDSEPSRTPEGALGGAIPAQSKAASPAKPAQPQAQKQPSPGGVSVSVDQIARPGAVVSGKVKFSDGQAAAWHLDQMGRLGLVPDQAGYRPPASDVQQFQAALESELGKIGF